MTIKFVSAICVIIALTAAIIGVAVPNDAAALTTSLWKFKSIVCDVTTTASGGGQDTDHFANCAAKIKEITGFCKNPAFGSAVESSGKPFTTNAFVSISSTGTWLKPDPGKAEQVLLISNEGIQEAFDISNSQNGQPFVFLKATQATCKKGWNSLGWFITKADAQLSIASVPSLQDSNHNVIASGHTSYQYETPKTCDNADGTPMIVSSASGVPSPLPLTTHCKCVAIPNWNFVWDATGESGTGDGSWNGSSYVYVKSCDLVGDAFRYCSRFPTPVATTVADGGAPKPADSGLRIYSYNASTDTGDPTTGEYIPLSVSDSNFKLNDCYLWRDVNKDPAFALDKLGTYDPDVAHIIPPQTGNPQQQQKGKGGQLVSVPDDKLGGMVLRSVSATAGADNLFTGECHQHGKETNGGGNYAWNQQGPAKTLTNPDGTLNIRDAMCQGASQLMDGVYDNGILP